MLHPDDGRRRLCACSHTDRSAADAHDATDCCTADRYRASKSTANSCGNRCATDAHRAARCVAKPTPNGRRNANADNP